MQTAAMQVKRLDHLVLTVADIARTVTFYQTVLGMRKVKFGEGRIALAFGEQKINLHQQGREFDPRAGRVQPGSADLCFIIDTPVEHALVHLERLGVAIVDGPVDRTGATGPIRSVYFRDPDDNLIEIANYTDECNPN